MIFILKAALGLNYDKHNFEFLFLWTMHDHTFITTTKGNEPS